MVWRIRKVEKNEKMGWNEMRKMSIQDPIRYQLYYIYLKFGKV